jgi:hypothetical protein
MNETIFHPQNETLELTAEFGFYNYDPDTSLIENHLLQLLKNESLISRSGDMIPLPQNNSSQPFEEQIRLLNTKDFTES